MVRFSKSIGGYGRHGAAATPRYSCDICGRRTASIYVVRDAQWACGACAGPDYSDREDGSGCS